MILLYKAPCHQSGTLHKYSEGNHIQLPDAEDDFLRHNAPDQRAEGPDKNHETCGVGSLLPVVTFCDQFGSVVTSSAHLSIEKRPPGLL